MLTSNYVVYQKLARIASGTLLAVLVTMGSATAENRPNILWITAEDMSPALGCYGDEYAITPNMDRLASQGVRYTRAFATAPVCSTARCCLITGCYPTTLGTHNMRSAFPIPDNIHGFPERLRAAGYFTTNNEKTDYNTANAAQITAACWNECSGTAHWRARLNSSQPFFAVFNLMDSHQSRSMVWKTEQFVAEIQSQLQPNEIHRPSDARLPAYYPESPTIRREWARFYDCVTAVDKQVGQILQQLEEDGLAEETIVFFFGDHGSGMPRHKRLLLDSGMRVPLIVRCPEKFQHLVDGQPGTINDRLVSFVDFAPTTLALAGLEAPKPMQGAAFLGKQIAKEPSYVYGHRDRVDEAFDTARSVRSRQYLYVRNYMPHLSYNQPSGWPDQGAIRHEFYRLASRLTMTDAQWHFVAPTRPVEELYDCESDPDNLINLCGSSLHANILNDMRRAHGLQVVSTLDRGFIPEAQAWQQLDAIQQNDEFLLAYEAAERVGKTEQPDACELLRSPIAAVRYWGVISLLNFGKLTEASLQALATALTDPSKEVQIEAAHALVLNGGSASALPVLTQLLADEDLNVVLRAMRTIELLGGLASSARKDVEALVQRHSSALSNATAATFAVTPEQDLAMFIGFSANAFLSRTPGVP